MVEAGDGFVLRRKHIEDDDLVGAGFEPGAGDVEGLLRADVPEAAEVVAVDPDCALAEGGDVEEGVAGGVRVNVRGGRLGNLEPGVLRAKCGGSSTARFALRSE